jgi:hypothetical protein
MLLPLLLAGASLAGRVKILVPGNRWRVLLPLAWLGWQLVSSGTTVDLALTEATLWQYAGCVACYFLGLFLFARERLLVWVLPGILAGFTFCTMRAVNQKLIEFPVERQALMEGQRMGWTNFPPENLLSMRNDGIILTTNGVDTLNPIILKKMERGRAYGTLVYPNALAGMILLLWPVSLALAFLATRTLKAPIRFAAIALTIFLGGAAFFASGSKLGWLIGILAAGLLMLRLKWPVWWKVVTTTCVVVIGLGVFALRFHGYFSAGATSMGARFDYWHAAVKITVAHPVTGTGPGTFQRSYAGIKAPDSEMARLTHNDYLEQFCDSGVPGGTIYGSWIGLAAIILGRMFRKSNDLIVSAISVGVGSWFLQSLGEFGLFIPASAWVAFTLLGLLIGEKEIEFDKKLKSR